MDKKNVLLDILRPFGIVSQYAGCAQLIRAVELTLENPDAIQAVHKQIYAVIAKEYGIHPKSVESNIRTVSAVAWATDPGRLKKWLAFRCMANRLPWSLLKFSRIICRERT